MTGLFATSLFQMLHVNVLHMSCSSSPALALYVSASHAIPLHSIHTCFIAAVNAGHAMNLASALVNLQLLSCLCHNQKCELTCGCRWGYGGLWASKALRWAHHTICCPHMHSSCQRWRTFWVCRTCFSPPCCSSRSWLLRACQVHRDVFNGLSALGRRSLPCYLPAGMIMVSPAALLQW